MDDLQRDLITVVTAILFVIFAAIIVIKKSKVSPSKVNSYDKAVAIFLSSGFPVVLPVIYLAIGMGGMGFDNSLYLILGLFAGGFPIFFLPLLVAPIPAIVLFRRGHKLAGVLVAACIGIVLSYFVLVLVALAYY